MRDLTVVLIRLKSKFASAEYAFHNRTRCPAGGLTLHAGTACAHIRRMQTQIGRDEPYFDEGAMREALCEIGRRVWMREYVASNDGNFSVRLSSDRVLATPTMVSKGFMRPEELAIVTLDGNQVSGPRPVTSELKMHLAIYRARPDVRAVVHVHPPHATAFAITRRPLPKCVLPEVEVLLGEIPMTPYETPGTHAFAEALLPYVRDHNAFLLTNHGAVTVGQDPYEAYYRMETLDQYCRILILAAHIGDWQQLDHEQVVSLLKIREKLGYRDRRLAEKDRPLCSPEVPPPSSSPEDIRRGSECAAVAKQNPEELIAEITKRVLARLRQK